MCASRADILVIVMVRNICLSIELLDHDCGILMAMRQMFLGPGHCDEMSSQLLILTQ